MNEGYKEIESHEERLTRELHDSPLTIPDSNDSIWMQIKERLGEASPIWRRDRFRVLL